MSSNVHITDKHRPVLIDKTGKLIDSIDGGAPRSLTPLGGLATDALLRYFQRVMCKRLTRCRLLDLELIRACLAGLCLFGMVGLAADRGLPAQDGIGNFGQVNEGLYRGAQPDEAAIQSLKHLGVKTILNLRMANDCWKKEAAVAQANGITYTNIPFKGTGRPADGQVARVLALLKNSSGAVFVHCQHGCDRTGMIIACYRIQHDGWTTETALAEARHFGMSRLEHGMRAYIVDFGKKAKQGDSRPKPTTTPFQE